MFFKDKLIGKFRCDLFVESRVIVELKSVTGFIPVLFKSQLLSYLKASNVKTGLLINFGNPSCGSSNNRLVDKIIDKYSQRIN